MTITHLDASDAYEIRYSLDDHGRPTVRILRFRGMMDGRGEEVDFENLPHHTQQGIKRTIMRELKSRKEEEDNE